MRVVDYASAVAAQLKAHGPEQSRSERGVISTASRRVISNGRKPVGLLGDGARVQERVGTVFEVGVGNCAKYGAEHSV